MKKTVVVCAILAMGLSSLAQASSRSKKAVQAKQEEQAQDSTPVVRSEDDMTGKIGVGAVIIPTAGTYVSAVTGSYWMSNKVALDGYLGAGGGSVYNGGTASNGAPVTDNTSNLFIAIGGRLDLARPTPDLHLQAIGRLSFNDLSTDHTALGNTATLAGSTVGIFVGAGFEGFIPGWHSVSIEVNSGLHLDLNNTSYPGNNLGSTSYYFGGGAGLVPVNLGIHYYF
jgi:hypothetical protein